MKTFQVTRWKAEQFAMLLIIISTIPIASAQDVRPAAPIKESESDRELRYPAGPPPRNPFVEALDINHDHRISAEELANATTALMVLDRDADGVLTTDEFGPPINDANSFDDHPGSSLPSITGSKPPSSKRAANETSAGGGAESNTKSTNGKTAKSTAGLNKSSKSTSVTKGKSALKGAANGQSGGNGGPAAIGGPYAQGGAGFVGSPNAQLFANQALRFDMDGDGTLSRNELTMMGEFCSRQGGTSQGGSTQTGFGQPGQRAGLGGTSGPPSGGPGSQSGFGQGGLRGQRGPGAGIGGPGRGPAGQGDPGALPGGGSGTRP